MMLHFYAVVFTESAEWHFIFSDYLKIKCLLAAAFSVSSKPNQVFHLAALSANICLLSLYW